MASCEICHGQHDTEQVLVPVVQVSFVNNDSIIVLQSFMVVREVYCDRKHGHRLSIMSGAAFLARH